MTQKSYKRLKSVRELMSMIGWILMVLNLCVAITVIISSILSGSSIISHERTMIVIFTIAIVIGVLAASDMVIYKKIRNVKLLDP